MCSLNIVEPVLTDFMTITTSTEPVLACLSKMILPVVLSKRLTCVEKPRWLYSNRGNVWSVSSTYTSEAATADADSAEAKANRARFFTEFSGQKLSLAG